MRRPLIILAVLAVTAALIVGIVQTGGGSGRGTPAGNAPSPAEARKALEGSPAPLAALHADANALLPIDGLDARLKALRGYPVVVNVWGSWCNPCREEFPILQRVAVAYGKRVAFVGVATQDAKEKAGPFLAQHPVTYPSYMDFDGKVADSYGVIGAPATIFFDAGGKRAYFHQGRYDTVADLEADIKRYIGA
ncbi:MAG: Redoxin domain protein [Solirubrobacterales bacterium]|nr:Redoxin domain protein [Solirubrobacterales bacterium]